MFTKPAICYRTDSLKQAPLNPDVLSKKTRKQVFLEQMELVVSWAGLEASIAPYYCQGIKSRLPPPFSLQTMLGTHFLQQWPHPV